jgi:hypothetical protein
MKREMPLKFDPVTKNGIAQYVSLEIFPALSEAYLMDSNNLRSARNIMPFFSAG